MRDPSIHIRKSDLKNMLVRILNDTNNVDYIVNELFNQSKSVSLRNRQIVYTSSLNKKKIIKNQVNSNPLIDHFQFVLESCRHERNHKSIKRIEIGSKQYSTLIEISNNVVKFLDLFKIDNQLIGLKFYINEGLNLMGKKYSLNKFKYYDDQINESYQNKLVIDDDPNPAISNLGYQYYKEKADYTSIDFSVDFVYMTHRILENQAEYKIWIDAQFEGLAFMNVIPEPHQLHSPKSIDRYKSFLLQNKERQPNKIFDKSFLDQRKKERNL